MLTLRPAAKRGGADHGWLETRHTFSFASYYDPRHMGFRSLRVINEDTVAPGTGFPTHPHRDMEILTYLVSGRLQHRDSMGHGSVIGPGDVQHITAGRGIQHSEQNASDDEPVHLLQIWIEPAEVGLEPSYDQAHFSTEDKTGRLCWLATGDGRDDSLVMRQDAALGASVLPAGGELALTLADGRHGWLQVVSGSLTAGGQALSAGDGLAVSDEPRLAVRAESDAELLWFDLA